MPIREIITILVAIASSIAGLVQPQIGMYGYVWFNLMRPDELSWSAGRFPYSMTMAICILLGNIRNLQRFLPDVLLNPYLRAFLLMFVPWLLSTALAADGDAAMSAFIEFLKMAAMLTILPTLMNRLEDVRRLFLLTALSIGFIGMYFGVVGTLKGGIKIINGIGGDMSDNNKLGLTLVMALPFCWYGLGMTKWRPLRFVLFIMVFGTIGAVVFTQSRGAILSLLLVLLLIVLHSRRKLVILAGLAVLAAPTMLLTWTALSSRMETLRNPEQEGSAWSRIIMMQGGIQIWRDYKIVGIGPGQENLSRISGNYGIVQGLSIHVTPIQVMVHFGTIGILCWSYLFGGGMIRLWLSARRMKRTRPGMEIYPRTLFISLAGFLCGSMVYPLTYYQYSYMFMVYGGCWLLAERQLLSESPAAQVEEATVPAPAAVPVVAASLPEIPVQLRRIR